MKAFLLLIFLFILNCSFDNKSGIWKNSNQTTEGKKDDNLSEFKTLSSVKDTFDKNLTINKNFKFPVFTNVESTNWKEIYYRKSNNLPNFAYEEKNELILKSGKITNKKANNKILSENNNIIINDKRGNIIIYSKNQNKILQKFNFYKKRFKNVEKNLNLIVEKNIIFVSDNLGYLYAYDYKKNKVIWAKDYKVPFRSNLKLSNNSLYAANQNNNLYKFNKKNGEILKLIPTEETIIKNQFVNSLSLNENYLFFLNTYGSLYTFQKNDMKLLWFLNLNQSTDLDPNNLFLGNQITNHQNTIFASNSRSFYGINANNGSVIFKYDFSPSTQPLAISDYLFLISKNNYLISINIKNGKLIYSYDLNQKIADFLNSKKRKANFKKLALLNNKIFVYLENSYFLKFDLYGKLEIIDKLPSKLNSDPIYLSKKIIFLNKKNKIVVIN